MNRAKKLMPKGGPICAAIFASLVVIGGTFTEVFAQQPIENQPAGPNADFFVYLPFVSQVEDPSACPSISNNTYALINVVGSYYKDNRLTDENADMRLSVLGYTAVNEALTLVDYNGPTDPNAPQISNVFQPKRNIAFAQAYRRHDWDWDENAAPPYGTRGGINNQWPVSVLDLVASQGEAVYIPRRDAQITGGGYVAMVLYADDDELAFTYGNRDRVDSGYTIYLANICVDANLVRAYRDQTSNGKRATGKLPILRNDQPVGTAKGNTVTIAVRDSGPFLDPRSRKDWWQR